MSRKIFPQYPKERPALPPAYQKIYVEHYRNNREGLTAASSVSRKLEAWLHRKVAAGLAPGDDKATLEIGAGTLNQLRYEDTSPYDIVEPFNALYEGSPLLTRVRHIYADIEEVPAHHRYQRITAIATFEHVLALPKVVARACLLLGQGGSLRVSIPNEGSPCWKLGWMLSTGLEFRLKYGLDYGLLMRHEHVNTANEVEEVLRYFFQKVEVSHFGLNRLLAFYRYCECSLPKPDLAEQYLEGE